MLLIIQFFILGILIWIFIQDLLYQLVNWILFPALVLGLLCYRLLFTGISDIGTVAFENLVFLLLQLGLLTFYLSIRRKRLVFLTSSNLLNWGDIIFLVSVACYFSLYNYILFYALSLPLILFLWVLIKPLFKSKFIPLAGLQSVLLAICLALDWWVIRLGLTEDFWVWHYYLLWIQ